MVSRQDKHCGLFLEPENLDHRDANTEFEERDLPMLPPTPRAGHIGMLEDGDPPGRATIPSPSDSDQSNGVNGDAGEEGRCALTHTHSAGRVHDECHGYHYRTGHTS